MQMVLTNIFLVRKRENVNEPFYTLELTDNGIKQLREIIIVNQQVVEFINGK